MSMVHINHIYLYIIQPVQKGKSIISNTVHLNDIESFKNGEIPIIKLGVKPLRNEEALQAAANAAGDAQQESFSMNLPKNKW